MPAIRRWMSFGRRAMACMLAAWLFPLPSAAVPNAAQYYEDALARYEKKDVKGAIIQLKNALQRDPKMLAAQVLLADAYLNEGQPAGAEAALEAAEKLGADRMVISTKLGQALLQQYKYQAVLDRLNHRGLPAPASAEVLVYRAYAHIGLGDVKRAIQVLEEAERLSPALVTIKLAKGTALIRNGDLAGARSVAAQAVNLAPSNAGVWNLKGSIAHIAGDLPAALDDYGKAIGLQPDHLEARISRAGLLIDLNRYAEAEKDLAYLKQRYPLEPRVHYVSSLAAARRGDAKGTHEALSEVARILNTLPAEVVQRSTQLLLLGGLAHYGLRQPEQAKVYLQTYIDRLPGDPGARKLMASLLLDEGDYNGVIELLRPVSGGDKADPQALALQAAAYLGKQQHQRASELFEEAARRSGNAPDIAVGLGMSRIGAGQENAGIALLQQVYAKDPSQTRAGMMLVGHHLRRGEVAKAIALASKIVEREPNNLTALNLLGLVHLAGRDNASARAAFTKALNIQRNFMPAQLNIARIDFAEGKRAEAQQRLKAILKIHPDHGEALHELARIEEREGRLNEAINWLERLRTARSQPLGSMLYLVDLYLKTGNTKNALGLAQEVATRYPENLTVLETVGRAYLAAGRPDQARVTFRSMSRIAGFDTQALTRIASLLMGAGDPQGAGFALDKALGNKPDYLPAKIARVELDIQTGNLASAERRAMELRDAHPGQTRIRHLLGTVRMAKKDWPGAVAEYKAALDQEPSTQNVLTLYRLHLQAGDAKSATSLLEDWLRTHPADKAARLALAEGYLGSGQLQEARRAYEAILKERSNDVGVLNNLANVLLKLGDRQALSYAEKAYALSPNDPDIIDTLGWVLVQQGKPEQALPYLRDARVRAAGNRVIQYHLGMALHRLGRNAEAKRELREALAGNAEFEGADEARGLLPTL